MEIQVIFDKIYYKGADLCKMERANKVLEEHFEIMKTTNPASYKSVTEKLEAIIYEISHDDAVAIVKAMKPHGERWSYTQVSEFLSSKNHEHDHLKFYMVMNMMYNDFDKVLESVNKSNDAEFYFEMSKAFIYDTDARPFKVERYFI